MNCFHNTHFTIYLLHGANSNKFLYLHSPKKRIRHLKKILLYINITVECTHLENDPNQTVKPFGPLKFCETCNVEVRRRCWNENLKSKKHLENDPEQTAKPLGPLKFCEKCNVQVRSSAWEAHLRSKTHLGDKPDKSRKVCEKCNLEIRHYSWYSHLRSKTIWKTILIISSNQ